MPKKKNKEGIKNEFKKLAIEITLELFSMGMTETEINDFWKECVDKVKNNKSLSKN
ncbi:MAG: hypothetical protein H7Y10_12145 [Flavobacterium sp.]|nr:hypothetical protein [Flavobacterium sp.]